MTENVQFTQFYLQTTGSCVSAGVRNVWRKILFANRAYFIMTSILFLGNIICYFFTAATTSVALLCDFFVNEEIYLNLACSCDGGISSNDDE
jgi:hypothetical protein